jgi:hypothetical protein
MKDTLSLTVAQAVREPSRDTSAWIAGGPGANWVSTPVVGSISKRCEAVSSAGLGLVL